MGRTKTLSKKNAFYISTDRRLELEHFCRQYTEWRAEYAELCSAYPQLRKDLVIALRDRSVRPAESVVCKMMVLSDKIDLVDRTALSCGKELCPFIRNGVIHGLTYDQMNARETMPVSRAEYYKAVRKFYWLLAQKR